MNTNHIPTLHKLESIKDLENYISQIDINKLRTELLKEFDRLFNYKNAKEWNELVRISECLLITGWGERTPLEATCNKWINGAFYSEIRQTNFELVSSKDWSQNKGTYVIYEGESDKTDYGIHTLASQRNYFPKCPIRWIKHDYKHPALQVILNHLEPLRVKMIDNTNPSAYGTSFSYLGIHLYFSHRDEIYSEFGYNYYHSEEDIPKDIVGKKDSNNSPIYYIRPKFKFGRLATRKNELKLEVTIHYTTAFNKLQLEDQKETLKQDFLEIINVLAKRLKKKKIDYKTDLLKQDVSKIMDEWKVESVNSLI